MNPYLNLFSQLIFVLFSFVATSAYAQTDQEAIKGGVCVVRVDDKVVLVHEILTKKLALPGGRVEPGEDPAITAQRETWEETGLVVSVKRELGRYDDAIFYDCVSDSHIVSFQFNNVYDGLELPVWFAPHYGVEVSSAMLVNPRSIPVEEYRFPEQVDWLKQMQTEASNQPITYVGNLVEAAPTFNQVELDWMIWLQSTIHELPDSLRTLSRWFIMGGNLLAEPLLLIILLPLAYMRYGRASAFKIFFAATVTALMSLAAQQGFAFPRPHVYLPAVELVQTYGYSFPSVPAAIWLAVGLLVLKKERRLSGHSYTLLFSALFLWLGLAKFYTGSAFLVDVISGALLGSLCAWHISRLENNPAFKSLHLFSSKQVWLALLIFCGVMILLWPSAILGCWFTAIASVAVVLYSTSDEEKWVSPSNMLLLIIVIFAANVAVSSAASLVSHSSILSFALEMLRYPLLITLFVNGFRKVSQVSTTSNHYV
ncbi:bifunctional NUDIX hydrolase/phosphatase PAP2 family protein [Vibrio hepatarius]|uniref:bifunctional NUDIX hydrolase/phosphatase PAP2 family protein n=1 Tax=Vibrio hepatarius TaxID=171383 RepID=UPI00142DB37D|nr:bifunctional NUDIX hydrolase/phosphatase PAP2 family protein [Vibrio hepatarius]NIY83236.1 NUDIX domain-containing protein [Vibrio hepatarius]